MNLLLKEKVFLNAIENKMTSWQQFIEQQKNEAYFQTLAQFIREERAKKTIFPKEEDVFRAFELTPLHDVKVIILGQDPYHGDHQAHGLSFSVQQGIKLPPSLKNIFKELESDLGVQSPDSGDLTNWANQGVLLLNTVLTVEKGKAGSHQNQGWEIFTNRVLELLNEQNHPVIFVLWGNPAQQKLKLITQKQHYVLMAPHPSPLSAYRGFFGSKPFSQVNQLLIQNQMTPIEWVKR